MNVRMMLVRCGDECCQCGNVANAKSNFQFGCGGQIGNWQHWNWQHWELATFPAMPAALKHGGK